ncbi:MAG: ATP-binding cassette domain-containing protein [Methanomicrobiales archaeon]|nr:ATP-binding cassette domain-containing protein [Methanomicrobiales archaeon]
MPFDPIIEFNAVHYAYPNLPDALRGISFAIPKGKKIALVGANGAGKTTLILMCNGMLRPARGEVRINGMPLAYTTRALREVRKKVGLVFQNSDMQLFAPTVYQDVAFGPLNLGMEHAAIETAVARSLRAVGLDGFEGRTPHHLSGGEKKRVAIAGILAMEPEVLIFDEPTSSLDPATAEEIMDLLEELNHGGRTILVSTHDVDLAYRWADEIILVKDGNLLCQGPPDRVFADGQLLDDARLKPPVLLELFRELVQRNLIGTDKVPRSILDVTDLLESRIRTPGGTGAPGSIYLCDVERAGAAAIREGIAGHGIAHTGAMGTHAKEMTALENIDVEFTFGVVDKCILKALNGQDSLILTSGGMVEHVGRRIRDYVRESGNPIPILFLSPEGGEAGRSDP